MAEVIGVASAVLALLEKAIDISGRIRDAHERQKDLGRVLESYKGELATTKVIIQTVKDEKALQTASVASELVNIEALGKRLVDLLQTLEPGKKGFLRQFIHQLVQGLKDEKLLAAIMVELASSKRNLSLKIQLANVGLTRTAQDTIVANAQVVEKINAILQGVLGEGDGLRIAQLLKDRSPGHDGMVPLSDADLASLNKPISSPGDPHDVLGSPADPTLRVVTENSTEEQALQINGPVGEEGWREVSHLVITRNQASGMSIQVNHAISEDVFERLLGARAGNSPRNAT